MQQQVLSFYGWLCLSVLAHLIIAALVLQQQVQPPAAKLSGAPVQVFAVNKSTWRQQPVAVAASPATVIVPQAQPAALARARAKRTTPKPQPAVKSAPKPTAKPMSVASVPPQSASVSATTSDAASTHSTDVMALFDSVRINAARRELSATELAALAAPRVQTQPERHSGVKRAAVKPGADAASDVLETLPDGTQLVRVGKQCVLAAPGADLRKNIHSMKVVSCGAGGRSEQDRIDTYYEQVMSGIGQQR